MLASGGRNSGKISKALDHLVSFARFVQVHLRRNTNKRLLQQAFTRKSYAVIRGRQHNDVMEFFGDRILDFAVTKDFYDQYGRVDNKNEFICSKSTGELSREDCNLVKNTNLAQQKKRNFPLKIISALWRRKSGSMMSLKQKAHTQKFRDK